ncbi:MAG: DUF2971 domain-containing protein [Sediminibacterium sp.]|nr:DUF2971 domain-containing protein [Sediminibacterium sp.]
MNIKDLSFSELVVLAVKTGQISRYAYKYRSINENTENIFTKAQLWFSNPDHFNDPFDCQIVVQANNTVDEISNFLRQNVPTMSSKDVKMYTRHWSKNLTEWRTMVNKTIKNHINTSGICCFAGSGDNILMWSHYSDSHKGICIKFDILADPDFFAAPLTVKYNKNYPKYDHIKDNSKFVEYLIKTKAECWKYEEELRILKQKFGLVNFKKEAIVEVIFGCACTAGNIAKIKKLISDNDFPNIKFKMTATSKSSYKLDIKDLK